EGCRRNELVGEPELAEDLDRPWLARPKRIGPRLDAHATHLDRGDLAADARTGLEHRDLGGRAGGEQTFGRGEPRDPPADHDDTSAHGGSSSAVRRTTSASSDTKAGSAFGISVRAN